jgi:hypothetical protein
MDGVLQDLRKLGVKSWWMVAKDRESWRKVLREADDDDYILSFCKNFPLH